MKKFFLASLWFFLVGVGLTWAQTPTGEPLQGVALSLQIDGEGVVNGAVICSTQEGYGLCQGEYDSAMFGVINDSPGVAFEATGSGVRFIVSDGIARVRVSTNNGAINEGDLITSSQVAGVAMKAVKNGYVLGSAMESYGNTDTNQVGEILVSLNIRPTVTLSDERSNLIELLRQGLSAPVLGPLATLRYLLAALMVIVSFVIGFLYFARVARTGVEALGRNPLAGRMIQLSIVFNVVLALVIIVAGLAIGYLILIL